MAGTRRCAAGVCPGWGAVVRPKFVAGGLMLLFCGLLAGCQTATSCRDLLRAKCLRCHGQATTCAKLGASEQKWQETIQAMVRLGADVSGEERKTLAACLSTPSGKGGELLPVN